jgi:hypothetical protein
LGMIWDLDDLLRVILAEGQAEPSSYDSPIKFLSRGARCRGIGCFHFGQGLSFRGLESL